MDAAEVNQALRVAADDKVRARERCRQYRRRILELSQRVTALHVAPAFSCLEIVDALYNYVMLPSDLFIMSKGHGCVAQYVVLEALGQLTREQLDAYCMPGGVLGAHPDYAPERGIQASTGSLGHGLAIAVGQAYAERLKGAPARVFCLLSDGECQEGSTWEAMMMAANLQLSNLIVYVDSNDFGGLARMSEGFPAFYPLDKKAEAFGWDSVVVEGHNLFDLAWPVAAHAMVLRGGPRPGELSKPLFVVCRTVKGKGVSYMENEPIWHYRSPNPEEYAQALRELE